MSRSTRVLAAAVALAVTSPLATSELAVTPAAAAAAPMAASRSSAATASPSWGAYNGVSTHEDNAFARMVGSRPRYASSYYTAARRTIAQVEFDRVAKGITPNISVSTKGYRGGFMRWANIAAGKHDGFWRSWGRSLHQLHHRVMFTFDQEPDARLNHGWVPAQKMRDYKRAYRRIHNLIEPIAPKVQWSYWVGGSDKAKVTAMYPGNRYVDRIGWDPYKWSWHPASEGPRGTWAPFLHWLNKQSWGRGKPRCLFETGIDVGHFGQARAADWWSKAPAAARRLNLQFFILFNRYQWRITGYDRVVTAYSKAMKTL